MHPPFSSTVCVHGHDGTGILRHGVLCNTDFDILKASLTFGIQVMKSCAWSPFPWAKELRGSSRITIRHKVMTIGTHAQERHHLLFALGFRIFWMAANQLEFRVLPEAEMRESENPGCILKPNYRWSESNNTLDKGAWTYMTCHQTKIQTKTDCTGVQEHWRRH